jgi:hypothetical protein
VKNGLRTTFDDPLIRVLDTVQLMSSTDTAAIGLNALFTFVAGLCSVLIFFASWMSFDANIRCAVCVRSCHTVSVYVGCRAILSCVCSENSREFGVLRAIGLDVGQVMRVYLYEALAVVLSSFLLGTIIGAHVGCCLAFYL